MGGEHPLPKSSHQSQSAAASSATQISDPAEKGAQQQHYLGLAVDLQLKGTKTDSQQWCTPSQNAQEI